MKTAACRLIVPLLWILTLHIVRGQGILYTSNLDKPTEVELNVASDSWVGGNFGTGANLGGYSLDAVWLRMETPVGLPSGLSVMLYGVRPDFPSAPGEFLGSLSGQSPSTGGIFRFSAPALRLAASSEYLVVVTAATALSEGRYVWGLTRYPPDAREGWWLPSSNSRSPNGVDWQASRGWAPQFAIEATPIPEPSVVAFGLLGVGWLGARRWASSRPGKSFDRGSDSGAAE